MNEEAQRLRDELTEARKEASIIALRANCGRATRDDIEAA